MDGIKWRLDGAKDIELLTCMHDSHVTRLIAENLRKRELGLLPDEWFPLDALICEHGRMDLLPPEATSLEDFLKEQRTTK